MGLRERKHLTTRKAIMKSAMELFNDRDFELITVEEIASKADVAKGTVYNYFRSKEEIAAAIANDEFIQGQTLIEDMISSGKTPIDILHLLFLAGGNWAEKNPRLAQITLTYVLRQTFANPGNAQNVLGFNSLYELILRMISLAQNDGQIRQDISGSEISQILALLYVKTLWQWTANPDGDPLSQRMERCLKTIFQGIAASFDDIK
jgi:AcrR family transcriptional regulator